MWTAEGSCLQQGAFSDCKLALTQALTDSKWPRLTSRHLHISFHNAYNFWSITWLLPLIYTGAFLIDGSVKGQYATCEGMRGGGDLWKTMLLKIRRKKERRVERITRMEEEGRKKEKELRDLKERNKIERKKERKVKRLTRKKERNKERKSERKKSWETYKIERK